MVRTTELRSLHGRILRFTTPGRPGAAAACYVALWRLPRPDFHQLVIRTFKAHHSMLACVAYSANISCNVSRTSVVVAIDSRPKRLTRRSLSTVRS